MSINGVYFQVYREITSGTIQLPGLPDVAMRVRRAVADEQNDLNKVVRIIQADPGLAAHLVRIANSPLYRTRVPAENLSSAVRCFGLEGTSNLVTSYILRSMYLSRSKMIRELLAEIWQQSVRVASISSVLASRCRGFDPHSAMLAGLLQEIGALPLLNRLEKQKNLTLDKAEVRAAVSRLTPQIGAHLLTHWGFDERYVEVARRRDAWDHDPDAPVHLADLVLMARLHTFIGTPRMHKFPRIDQVTAYAKLPLGALSPRMSLVMLDEAGQDIEEVRQLLAA
ncbi:MAG: HDOD domain-containing protein [Pseudomonadales bacterium]